MAMTLKTAPHDGDPLATIWIGGVESVHRIARAMSSDYLEKWELYFKGDGIRNYAANSPSKELVGDLVFTLLWVVTEHDDFYVGVQSAWLLGDNGDTIERIAP